MNTNQADPAGRFDRVAKLVAWCFSRLFSEARVLARMKLLAFASFLTFVGLGFMVRITDRGMTRPDAERFMEFVLSSPSLGQTISAVVALAFVLGANLYSRVKRQEYETELLKIAADPATPDDVRRTILRGLESR